MNGVFLGIMMLGVFGLCIVFVFSTEGDAASLTTSTKINKIGTLEIKNPTLTGLIGTNLGTSSGIQTVILDFKNNVPNNTVLNISLKNLSGTQIGSGSVTVSPSSNTVTINLSDTVTSVERPTLRTIEVT